MATGRCELELETNHSYIYSLAWSQDGTKLALGSKDKTIEIWNAATGEYISKLEGHETSVNVMAWSYGRLNLPMKINKSYLLDKSL